MNAFTDRAAIVNRLRIRGIPTDQVCRIRRGEPDANGQPALERVAEGDKVVSIGVTARDSDAGQ